MTFTPTGGNERGHAPRGPLHGVRVLDLTRVLAGPFCTTLMWELGAEVLKIEQPGQGDDTRAFPPFQNGESVYFAAVNRGKRSLALDLKVEADRAMFERLLARADVLVENFRPEVMTRLGFGEAAVRARHPRLIYASVSGFGHTGPYADRPAYDLVVQALGGMISINGPDGGPGYRLGVSLGDLAAGVFATTAISAALFDRTRTGQGRFIDIAMLDVQTMLLESALVRQFAGAGTQGPTGSRHPVIAPFDVYATEDRPLAIACANDRLFAELAAALGRPELATDARFASLPARSVNHLALKQALEAVLAGGTAQAWEARLLEAGVPCAPVNTMAEVAVEPQLQARGMFVDLVDAEMGPLRMTGNPFRMSGFERPTTRPPAPNLDEARGDLAGWLEG
jgi:CoA:oxalate CoA-transferase